MSEQDGIIFFLLSKRTGLSPNKSLSDIQNGDRSLDKAHRQIIQGKAKNLYRKNFDFVQKFKHRTKVIGKLNTKDKANQKRIKAPLRIPRPILKEKSKLRYRKHFELILRFGYASGLKPEMKQKTTKLYHKNFELTKRFNMTQKYKSKGMDKEI